MGARKFPRVFLLIPSLVVLYFVFCIFHPFLLPISLAIILTTLCYPAFNWICIKLKIKRGWAALITSFGVTAIIIFPIVLLLIQLTGEVRQVYQQFQTYLEQDQLWDLRDLRIHSYLKPFLDWADGYIDLDQIDLARNFAAMLQQGSVFFLRYSTTILGSVLNFFTSFLLMLFTMFFLFRDGPSLVQEIKALTPLSGHHEKLIVGKFREVAGATVLGSLLTALAQGFAGGLVFYFLGIHNVVLWATLMALFSLVPVVGTAIVWVPWALYFFVAGFLLKGIILVVVGVVFVGSIDNLLRPWLIEGRAKMHTLVVFLSIMGGIGYFGIIGMIFGPIIVALGMTFLELYKLEFQKELSKPAPE